MPRCLIIAGPNGAGKTTFAMQYLPQVAKIDTFINADLIASGLSPFAPQKQAVAAARLFCIKWKRPSKRALILLLKRLFRVVGM
jgi:predicted ABC-type ATPase